VNRLIRVSFGPFQLRDLEPGGVEPVKRRVLVDQLGRHVAETLGLIEDDASSAGARRRPARPGHAAKG
jgi:23S rRNA pseudouridine2605 synthase